jgi:transglutaminase 1
MLLLKTYIFKILHIKNNSISIEHVVEGRLNVEPTSYTGRKRNDLKSMNFTETIEPSSGKKVVMDVTFDEYYKKLLDQSAFKISCKYRYISIARKNFPLPQ